MTSRYENRDIIVNDSKTYSAIFKDRGIKQVRQFGTKSLKFPTEQQLGELDVIGHTWRYGDRYFRLAHLHYGDSTLWWVIAFFNQLPTESSLEFGQLVFIPHPLERVLNMYGV